MSESWWKRWEHLLDSKPREAREVLIDHLAQELSDLIIAFPPAEGELHWEDAAMQKRYAGRLNELPAISLEMAGLLGDLVMWDLGNEIERVDHFFRNSLYGEICPTQAHLDALHLAWRMLTETLLTRKDQIHSAIKRADLVEAARRFKSVHPKRATHIQ
jgi:hypothetical protein